MTPYIATVSIYLADDWGPAATGGSEGHLGPGELSRAGLRGPRGGPEKTRRAARDGHGPRERAEPLEADAPRAPREAPGRGPRQAGGRGAQVDLLRAHRPGPKDPPSRAGDDRRLAVSLRPSRGCRRVSARHRVHDGHARCPRGEYRGV